MKSLIQILGLALSVCLVAGHVGAASLSEELASRGHANTKACVVTQDLKGLHRLLVVQFEEKPNRAENEREAVEILKLAALALVGADHFYVGFHPDSDWRSCRNAYPQYVFWRDYQDNWRFMSKAPLQFLQGQLKHLPPSLRNTYAEAFVLVSLGMVEQRVERITRSIQRFEKAEIILANSEGPGDLRRFVLATLIRHHLTDDRGDADQGEMYLNTYALILEPDEALRQPLIRVPAEYPRGAVLSRMEGYVVLEFTVTREGRVDNPVVIEADPPGVFDESAIEAVEQFRYVPPIEDGEPVEATAVTTRIDFQLPPRG
ncbi:MAG: energy transducer TonB [Gammaproteobacteria bacterium]